MAVEIRPPSLPAGMVEQLMDIVGEQYVSLDDAERIVYSRDCWPRTILWTRQGKVPYPPDAIVRPGSTREVREVLRICHEAKIPVTPFSASSSVVGGCVPLKGGISLDMKRLNRLISVNPENMIAEVEPGIYGVQLEQRLNEQGFTLGHFPSSIVCSTPGGWIAARSAGQCSSYYGKIEDMIRGMEVVLPSGELIRIGPTPPHLSSVDWNQIVTGSEGFLAVVTRAWLQVHPAPQSRSFHAVTFKNVAQGIEAMRQIMQEGCRPAAMRLYDAFDTLINRGKSNEDPEDLILEHMEAIAKAEPAKGLAKWKSRFTKKALGEVLKRPAVINRLAELAPSGCLLVMMFEGPRALTQARQARALRLCRTVGCSDMGEEPARRWYENRYAISFKQSKIMMLGAVVDTMEVACEWSKIAPLYKKVRDAVGSDVFVMAHFSHAYQTGCCIYFSFAVSGDSDAQLEEIHERVWERALKAVREVGATISHHHGVGFSKGAFMLSEHGSLMGTLLALKQTLDPAGIMNPGKLGL